MRHRDPETGQFVESADGESGVYHKVGRYDDLVAQRCNVAIVVDMSGGTGPDLPPTGRSTPEVARLHAARDQLDSHEVAELVGIRHDFAAFIIHEDNWSGTTPGSAYWEWEWYMEDAFGVEPDARQRSFVRQQPVTNGGFGTGDDNTDFANSIQDPGGGGRDASWVTTPAADSSVMKGGAYLTMPFNDTANGTGGGGGLQSWPSTGTYYNLRHEFGTGPFIAGDSRGQSVTGHDLTLGYDFTWSQIDNQKLEVKHATTVYWDIFEREDQRDTLQLKDT